MADNRDAERTPPVLSEYDRANLRQQMPVQLGAFSVPRGRQYLEREFKIEIKGTGHVPLEVINKILAPVGASVINQNFPELSPGAPDDITFINHGVKKGGHSNRVVVQIGPESFMAIALAYDYNCRSKLPDGPDDDKDLWRKRWDELRKSKATGSPSH